jgi:hypothetical protein
MFAPITADLHANEGLCLHQSQQSLMQMKDCICTNHSRPSYNEGLCLHQSEQNFMQMKGHVGTNHSPSFLWSTRGGAPPLAWVEMAAGPPELPEAGMTKRLAQAVCQSWLDGAFGSQSWASAASSCGGRAASSDVHGAFRAAGLP